MQELVCTRCNIQSPEHALYCQQCGQPLRCKQCGTPLLSVARACIQCGKLIPERSNTEQFYTGAISTPPGYSRLKWHETTEVRDFDLIIANDSIEHVRDFLPILGDNSLSKRSKSSVDHELQQQTELVEVTQDVPPVRPQLPAASSQTTASQEGIWEIFRNREGRLTQERRDLKAANKKDYIIRLAHLYLYAKYQLRVEKVPRDDVFKILDESGFKDTRRSAYILESGIRSGENEMLYLTLDGRDRANKFLTEALDPTLPVGWPDGVESRSVNSRAKKPIKKDGDDAVIMEWTTHPTTAELAQLASHSVIDTMSEQNRALFALYCLHKVGITKEVQVSQISSYLYKAFKIQLAATNLPRALAKSVKNRPALAIHRKNHGYQITDSGIEHIEKLLQSGK